MSKFDAAAIEAAFGVILKAIGEDCGRQGLQDTPKRIAKMYEEIFSGINVNLEDQMQVTFYETMKRCAKTAPSNSLAHWRYQFCTTKFPVFTYWFAYIYFS